MEVLTNSPQYFVTGAFLLFMLIALAGIAIQIWITIREQWRKHQNKRWIWTYIVTVPDRLVGDVRDMLDHPTTRSDRGKVQIEAHVTRFYREHINLLKQLKALVAIAGDVKVTNQIQYDGYQEVTEYGQGSCE